MIIKGELFIFGGINGNEYIGSEMLIIDLNSNSKCLKDNSFLIKFNKQKKLLRIKSNNNNIENKDKNNNKEKWYK